MDRSYCFFLGCETDKLLTGAFQKQRSPKQIWFITYGAGGQSITPEMLKSCGVVVDQCYTVCWRESKYTLIHLPRQFRLRHSSMANRIQSLPSEYGVILGGICGFDSIASNAKVGDAESLESHPGFKRMVDALNSENRNEDLKWWTEIGGDIACNKKGLLWKYIEETDISMLTKTQLVNRAREWTSITRENKKLKASNEFMVERLQETEAGSQNAVKPIPTTRTILASYRKNHLTRNLMKQVIKAEKNLNKKELRFSDGSGEIYAAQNVLMMHLFKLGFTGRDAVTRVKELQTAGVLEPFQLIRCVRVPNASLYEKAMHFYFKDVRVYRRKEFFAVSAEEINTFFDIVEGTDANHTEEQEQWAYALAKVAKRLC